MTILPIHLQQNVTVYFVSSGTAAGMFGKYLVRTYAGAVVILAEILIFSLPSLKANAGILSENSL
jgi:hypothetical protein